jgi:hypothetical protein
MLPIWSKTLPKVSDQYLLRHLAHSWVGREAFCCRILIGDPDRRRTDWARISTAPAEDRDVLELTRYIVGIGSRHRQQAPCTFAKTLASSDTRADGVSRGRSARRSFAQPLNLVLWPSRRARVFRMAR